MNDLWKCRRQHKRYNCCLGIQYVVNEERKSHKGLIWDISLGGAFALLLHSDLQTGDEILVRFLNGYGYVRGVIVKGGMDGYGIKFHAEAHELLNLEVVLKSVIASKENTHHSSLFKTKNAKQLS